MYSQQRQPKQPGQKLPLTTSASSSNVTSHSRHLALCHKHSLQLQSTQKQEEQVLMGTGLVTSLWTLSSTQGHRYRWTQPLLYNLLTTHSYMALESLARCLVDCGENPQPKLTAC